MRKYGRPYKGSKNKIAEKIINVLPEAEYFVDLFGGGGAMVDCAMQSGKYQKGIYNELEPLIYKGFTMAVRGEFKHENRWISREDFFKLKDTDPYVAICWSFGNDLKTYLYSPELERLKKHLHYIFFAGTPKEARLHWKAFVREYIKNPINVERLQSLESLQSLERLESLQSLERLESLESLERLERLERLETFNLSYEQVQIPENAVVYCDIPYKSTSSYLSEFSHDKFYDWCRQQKGLVFISEYQMPDDFYVVAEWSRTGTLSSTNRDKVTERLFCNKPYKPEKQLSLFAGGETT